MVVRDDSKRSLDMDEIIDSVKAQYATMASRSREEVENWNKKKVKKEKKELKCRRNKIEGFFLTTDATFVVESTWKKKRS